MSMNPFMFIPGFNRNQLNGARMGALARQPAGRGAQPVVAQDSKESFVAAYLGTREPTFTTLREKFDTLGDETTQKWWLKMAALCQTTGMPVLPLTTTGRRIPVEFSDGLTTFLQDNGGADGGLQFKRRGYTLGGFIKHQYDNIGGDHADQRKAAYLGMMNAALAAARVKYHQNDGDGKEPVPDALPDVDGAGNRHPSFADPDDKTWSDEPPAGTNLAGFNAHGPIIPGLPILVWKPWVDAGFVIPEGKAAMVIAMSYWRPIWNMDPGLDRPVSEMTIGEVKYTFLRISLSSLWSASEEWTATSTGRNLNAMVVADWMQNMPDSVKFTAVGALISLQFSGIQNSELRSPQAQILRYYFQAIRARHSIAVDLWPSAARYWVIRLSETCRFNRIRQAYTISNPYWMNSPITSRIFVSAAEKQDFIRQVGEQAMAAMQQGLNPGAVLTAAQVSPLIRFSEEFFPGWARGYLTPQGQPARAVAQLVEGHGLFH